MEAWWNVYFSALRYIWNSHSFSSTRAMCLQFSAKFQEYTRCQCTPGKNDEDTSATPHSCTLEHSKAIDQAIQYDAILIVPSMCHKSSLTLVPFLHHNEAVCVSEVQLGEDSGSTPQF